MVAFAVACSSETTIEQNSGSATGTASSASSSSTSDSVSSSVSSSSSSSGTGGAAPDCAAAAKALEDEIWTFGPAAEVTIAVRFSLPGINVAGFAVIGGFSHNPTEDEARAAASKDTMIPFGAKLETAPMPADEFMFRADGPEEIDVAAVSGRSGVTVFGANWIMAVGSSVYYPKTWHPAKDLGIGCMPQTPFSLPARAVETGDNAQAAVDTVEKLGQTALPDAISHIGGDDILVFDYPGSPVAERVALVNVTTPAP